MRGLGTTTKVTGEGYIEWQFRDDYEVEQTIKVKVLLVPCSRFRLFSPQEYFEQEQGGELTMNAKGSSFKFVNGSTLTFQYSSRTRFPIEIATR